VAAARAGDGLKMDKWRKAMSDKKSEKARDSKQTLRDDQIVTERMFGRRSFLTAVGSIVVGGAAAVVLGDTLEAAAQQGDPDAKKASDPNSKEAKKQSDPDAKKKSSTMKKQGDSDAKDAKKASDPDAKKKSSNPDSKKATDPDQKK
jgi:cytoskeletal protein RodZ